MKRIVKTTIRENVLFVCDFCGSKRESAKEAEECEKKHGTLIKHRDLIGETVYRWGPSDDCFASSDQPLRVVEVERHHYGLGRTGVLLENGHAERIWASPFDLSDRPQR